MTRLLVRSSTLYRNLLHVFPAELREEFGPEMTLVFEDDLREACLDRGVRGFLGVWGRAAMELLHAGLSKAWSQPGIVVPLISMVASACCFSGQLALARAHAPASSNPPGLVEAVLAVVVLPSLTAAVVSFIVVRAGVRVAPLRLTREASEQF